MDTQQAQRLRDYIRAEIAAQAVDPGSQASDNAAAWAEALWTRFFNDCAEPR